MDHPILQGFSLKPKVLGVCNAPTNGSYGYIVKLSVLDLELVLANFHLLGGVMLGLEEKEDYHLQSKCNLIKVYRELQSQMKSERATSPSLSVLM